MEDIKIDDLVILDKGKSTECIVTVKCITERKLFASVCGYGVTWDVMYNRLTKKGL